MSEARNDKMHPPETPRDAVERQIREGGIQSLGAMTKQVIEKSKAKHADLVKKASYVAKEGPREMTDQPTPSQPERAMTLAEAIWNLRVVAKQWLLEHADNPEAPAIRKALDATKDLV